MVMLLNQSVMKVTDDGTKITLESGDTKLLNVNKTSGNLGIGGGLQVGQTL